MTIVDDNITPKQKNYWQKRENKIVSWIEKKNKGEIEKWTKAENVGRVTHTHTHNII